MYMLVGQTKLSKLLPTSINSVKYPIISIFKKWCMWLIFSHIKLFSFTNSNYLDSVSSKILRQNSFKLAFLSEKNVIILSQVKKLVTICLKSHKKCKCWGQVVIGQVYIVIFVAFLRLQSK